MIPLTISVCRYNDPQKRVYNCSLVDNRILTPVLLRYILYGAALFFGTLPPEHTVHYSVEIGVKAAKPISFENTSTGNGLSEMIIESAASVALLMNNPFQQVEIDSIDVNIDISSDSVISRIWSADLSDLTVKPGQDLKVGVLVESYRGGKKRYTARLKIPKNLQPGRYQLLICGGAGYLQFLRQAAPYKFIPENFTGLVDAINNILQVKRDRLYCLIMLPPGGMSLERAELPDLPGTKMLVLEHPKRTLQARPYQHWIETSFATGTVVIDQKKLTVIVEK